MNKTNKALTLAIAYGLGFGTGLRVTSQHNPQAAPGASIPEVVVNELEKEPRSIMDCPGPLKRKELMNVSAYCPCEKCCGEYSKGKHNRQTANGYRIQPGDRLIAAPKSVPFGTWINVPGYGKAQVKDRGGAIKDNRLDLYFDTHQEALNFGRQYLWVTFE